MGSRGDRFEDGYDTVGGIGPFYDAVDEEGLQIFDEREVNFGLGLGLGGTGTTMSCVDSSIVLPAIGGVQNRNSANLAAPVNVHVPISDKVLGK